MPSNRIRDPNGFLTVSGCPISSYGIFQYSAAQLKLPGDPNRIVNVFRPESAVSDPEALKSFQNVPLIDDHEMLSGFSGDDDATAPEDYGIDGVLTSNVYYEAPWMRGDLKVFTREMQEALNSGKKDLSLGYSCDFEVRPGVFNGVAYEVVQTNMRGNHIALVGEGRVPGAKVLDGLIFDSLSFSVINQPRKGNDMKRTKKVMDNAVAQLKQLLPALEQFLNEEAGEVAHQDPAAAEAGAVDPAAAAAAVADPAVADDPNAALAANIEGAAPADPAAAAEPAAPADVESTELPQLIAQAEAVLSAIKKHLAGPEGADPDAAAAEPAADPAAADPVADPADPKAADTGLEGAGGEDPEAATGDVEAGTTGLDPNVIPGAKGQDAALQRFYADSAAKTRLYDRLSPVVGAFDHARLSAGQVAAYGVKKLGLKAAKGTEYAALDGYLSGLESAALATKTKLQKQVSQQVGDAAAKAESELDIYLKG